VPGRTSTMKGAGSAGPVSSRGRNLGDCRLSSDMPKELDKSHPDRAIARLAANQYGVITTAQLLNAGLLQSGIADRKSAGRLHPVHRGVHAVGHARLSDRGRWMAAVLACGKGAVLSHTSAGELWGIFRRPRRQREAGAGDEVPDVHVTVPTTNGLSKRTGIVLHRSSTLIDRHCTSHGGIPVTTPSRTLADMKPLVSPAQVSAAVREAEYLRLRIDEQIESDRARSDLEQAMLRICRRHRLTRPEVNVKVDRYEVDFIWRDHPLIVEVDGWEGHRGRSAFEEDRARDARLAVLGYQVVRFTWLQLERDPSGVARTIRALLRARAA
jgi:very-short-patch-repair endonuclease